MTSTLTARPATGEYFRAGRAREGDAKAAANWMMGEVLAALKATERAIEQFDVRATDVAALLTLVRDGVISHSAAKHVFATMVKTGDPPARIAERDGLLKVTDDAALVGWIDAVFAEFPDESTRYLRASDAFRACSLIRHEEVEGSADPKRESLLAARVDDRAARPTAREPSGRGHAEVPIGLGVEQLPPPLSRVLSECAVRSAWSPDGSSCNVPSDPSASGGR
jgi:hypothetical protein